MSITLKIISYQRLTPGQQTIFQTDLDKISIGRNSDNHWTLPDPQRFMSGTHCWLEDRDGTWFVTDTSTNGVFINGSDQRLIKDDSVALDQGDRIRLGDYELEVDLQEYEQLANSSADSSADPFNNDEEDIFETPDVSSPATAKELKDVNTPLAQMDSSLLGDSVSIDDLYELDGDEEAQEVKPTLASQGGRATPLRRHFSAPDVAAREPENPLPDQYAANLDAIPDNWDEETGLIKSPVATKPPSQEREVADPPDLPAAPDPHETARSVIPEPAPQTRATPSRKAAQRINSDSALEAFAAGSGLDLNQLQVENEMEFFQDLGLLLKTMTEGLMQANAAKSQVKVEFHLEQTMIAATENNPFKFSVSAQEAMTRLFNRSDSAYLSGSIAAAEVIDDINAHQMAVLAGTEAALKSILRRFRPAMLESKFGDGSILNKALPYLILGILQSPVR
jgi:type VI secretion system protein